MIVESLERRCLFSNLPTGFNDKVLATDIGSPTAIDVLPDGRALIAIKTGALRLVVHNAVQAKNVLSLPVDSAGERGLIGITHDPHFDTNHFIYIYHTVPASSSTAAFNEISRYTLNARVADPSSRVDILALNHLSAATNHNGGAMRFGSDDMLYVGVGENAKSSNSQSLENLLGKVLRIDVSHIQPGDPINDVAKLVPAGNPFATQTSGINGAIYALGFRNPFTIAVQPVTGTIFVDDVGSKTWEEIDRLLPGRNYGWPRSEGFAANGTPAQLGPGVYADPILSYNHHGGPAGGGNAIIGGAFYDPATAAAHPFPADYVGKYFYADYGHNYIRVFNPRHPGRLSFPDTSTPFEMTTAAQPTGVAMASDGSLYYIAEANGGELDELTYRA
ncbi:MAG: PQQ-dependent sugar dehydrogenase [Phycisphaerae bacterium]|nr:PQQ-dependent sugar dehydrogenase [Phycisphaerae bacterium]